MELKSPARFPAETLHVLEIIGNADRGGMENYLKSFVENLPADKIDLTCICPYESDFTSTLRQLGVKDIFIARIEDDPYWRSIQLAVEVCKLKKIDVIQQKKHYRLPLSTRLEGTIIFVSTDKGFPKFGVPFLFQVKG